MNGERYRYFIELQPSAGTTVPRYLETETRRQLATHFIEMIGEWLKEQALADKVSNMAITALGQVQITCETDVINYIRNQDVMNIAAIRQGAIMLEPAIRWNEIN